MGSHFCEEWSTARTFPYCIRSSEMPVPSGLVPRLAAVVLLVLAALACSAVTASAQTQDPVVFSSTRTSNDENAEIYVMNADGTGQRRVTASTANDVDPKWIRGGAQIIFTRTTWTRTSVGVSGLYVINADGTG